MSKVNGTRWNFYSNFIGVRASASSSSSFHRHCHRITFDYSSFFGLVYHYHTTKIVCHLTPTFSSTLSYPSLKSTTTLPRRIQTTKKQTFNENHDNRNLIFIRFCIRKVVKMVMINGAWQRRESVTESER